MDSGLGVPIGAEVKVTDTGQFQLIDDEGKVCLLTEMIVLCVPMSNL